MQAFSYARPQTLEEALHLLSPKWGETEILAGGTDLLSLMKENAVAPARVVNIKGLAELGRIQEVDGSYRVGALVTFEEFLAHAGIRKYFPSLTRAANGVTSPQIRSLGTVGGDLLQRPRCWYYRAGFGLLARDEKGRALVPGGDNRYHAIFSTEGPAYFVSPSSLAPPLVALGAKVRLRGPSGSRELDAAEFFVAPKNEGEREHAIRPDEILTEILIPSEARALRNATYEVRQKEALDWPLATASVALKMGSERISSARVVLGHVAPIPWRSRPAETALEGKIFSESVAAEAGAAAVREAKPLSRNGYKVQLARVAVLRALASAAKEGA